jgi:hypothetical protein
MEMQREKSVKTSRADTRKDTYKKELYCGAVKRLATTNLKLCKHKKKPWKKNQDAWFPIQNFQQTFKQRNFTAQINVKNSSLS